MFQTWLSGDVMEDGLAKVSVQGKLCTGRSLRSIAAVP
jgi:hypothetical protein